MSDPRYGPWPVPDPSRRPNGMLGRAYWFRVGGRWRLGTVLIQPGGGARPANVLVLLEDGTRTVCPAYPRRTERPAGA